LERCRVMTTRPLACALVVSVLVSCGARADLIDGSPAGTKGGGTLHRPAATAHDAGVGPDANVAASAEGVAAAANTAARALAGLAGAVSAPSSSQTPESCVNIDLASFDRSCRTDSDCMAVRGGMACPSGCACPNTAINVDDRLMYEETVASLPFTLGTCPCPSGPPHLCTQGVCTY
jgi:hypothetical protein